MIKYVLVKKKLKYTLQELKIPMPSKRDTITIFTCQFMYKVDIKQITPTSKLFINIFSKEAGEPASAGPKQTNPQQTVQPQKIARNMKFRIKEVHGWYSSSIYGAKTNSLIS